MFRRSMWESLVSALEITKRIFFTFFLFFLKFNFKNLPSIDTREVKQLTKKIFKNYQGQTHIGPGGGATALSL